jgi:hypothetical protein
MCSDQGKKTCLYFHIFFILEQGKLAAISFWILEHRRLWLIQQLVIVFGVPPTIWNLNSLVDLTFAHNRLSGQIPDNIGNLVQLRALKLDGNNPSGRIPTSIGRCTSTPKAQRF